ncbi:MAG: MFS transporter [Gammaproteobacteria bacterium]|nr:MFS transporter [Gammaproteobacteria bacterium]
MPILLSTILMSGLGFGLVLPSFLFVAENLGAPAWVATTIIGTFAIGQVISTPIWGRLSDRFGRKPILVISLAGQAASYVLLAFADTLWMMAIARTLNGLMSGNLSVAMAYVTDVTTPEKRAGSMGLVGGAISLGFIVGPAVGGVLGGADAESATLLLPGIVAAVVCAITSVGALLFLRESLSAEQRRHHAENSSQEGGLRAAGRLLQRPTLALMIMAGFLVYIGMALFETIFPLWSGARFGWGPREVGFIFTYLGLLVGTVQGVLVGRLVPRFGEGKLVTFGLACYPIGLLIMTQAPTWPVMMFGITFTAGGGALFITTMSSLVSHQAGEQERGLVMGVYQSGSWLGRSVGPPITGFLFGALGANAPLYAAALCMLPALAIVAVIRSRTSRPEHGREKELS